MVTPVLGDSIKDKCEDTSKHGPEWLKMAKYAIPVVKDFNGLWHDKLPNNIHPAEYVLKSSSSTGYSYYAKAVISLHENGLRIIPRGDAEKIRNDIFRIRTLRPPNSTQQMLRKVKNEGNEICEEDKEQRIAAAAARYFDDDDDDGGEQTIEDNSYSSQGDSDLDPIEDKFSLKDHKRFIMPVISSSKNNKTRAAFGIDVTPDIKKRENATDWSNKQKSNGSHKRVAETKTPIAAKTRRIMEVTNGRGRAPQTIITRFGKLRAGPHFDQNG